MALAALLSAMKEIILSCPVMPEEEEQRRLYLKDNFPKLSSEEVEDLSKISPKKFQIYSNSIFSGERNLIKRNFPMTIAALANLKPDRYSKDSDLTKLLKDLHKQHPWQSTQTVELGKNFVAYIKGLPRDLISKAPYLAELAEFELQLRIVRRTPDDEIMPADSLSEKELSSMTVEAVLGLKYLIPSFVIFAEFDYDVPAARQYFTSNKRILPESIGKKFTCSAISRNAEGLPRWRELNREIYRLLQAKERKKPHNISEIVETLLSTEGQLKDEIQLFKSFMDLLSKLIASGVVVVIAD